MNGEDPSLKIEDLSALAEIPVRYSHPGSWSTPYASDSDPEFEVWVSSQDNTIKTSIDSNWHSPASARAYALALLQAAKFAEEEARNER